MTYKYFYSTHYMQCYRKPSRHYSHNGFQVYLHYTLYAMSPNALPVAASAGGRAEHQQCRVCGAQAQRRRQDIPALRAHGDSHAERECCTASGSAQRVARGRASGGGHHLTGEHAAAMALARPYNAYVVCARVDLAHIDTRLSMGAVEWSGKALFLTQMASRSAMRPKFIFRSEVTNSMPQHDFQRIRRWLWRPHNPPARLFSRS